MNNYEDWAQLVAKNLKGEADFIAAIDKDELNDTAATQAFIRAVLEPFLPENFGIGTGRVVDAFGNYSDQLDIIIYNRDFPRIGLRGTHAAYLYESVLAVFAIRAKFVRKTFFDALTACASLADLSANIDKLTMAKLAKKNSLTRDANNKFVHRDSLRTERFSLIGRPPAFVFGFTGIKNSYRQLQENIELWIEQRRSVGAEAAMKSLPAVIATQGCFAWRNAAPLALSDRNMLGIGNDEAPVRLIILQLLYLLNRRLHVSRDGYGLKPNLRSYLGQFSPPKFELGVGSLDEAVGAKSNSDRKAAAAKLEAAFDRAPPATSVAPAPDAPIKDSAPAKRKQSKVPKAALLESALISQKDEPAAPKLEATFDPPPPATSVDSAPDAPKKDSAPTDNKQPAALKAAPLGSAPIPQKDEPAAPKPEVTFDQPPPATSVDPARVTPMKDSAVTDKKQPAALKAAPLGSAPIPMKDEPSKPKTAPLGSASIPPMGKSTAQVDTPAAGNVIPPKPPVDFELDAMTESSSNAAEAGAESSNTDENDFANTVVIPPPDDGDQGGAPRNSTDAFIARVKEQLSSSEPVSDRDIEKGSFSSTIPQ